MTSKRLEFSNKWMFNRVLCEDGICRRVLKAILDIEVGEIGRPDSEKVYEPGVTSHGVRMDVVAKTDGRIYDVEMQIADRSILGMRMRYYQAALDTSELRKGDDYERLPESYILFVCDFDAYGFGRPVYTLDRLCREEPTLQVGNKSHWMVLNARAWDRADGDLGDLLHYVCTGTPAGLLSCDIDTLVASYNQDRKWVNKVLTLEEDTAIRCRRARAEGRDEGENRLASLMTRLMDEGRAADAAQAARDRARRNELYREFGL